MSFQKSSELNPQIKLVILQYAGDYKEAFERINNEGIETYYAQKYSIDFVEEIAKSIQETTTICLFTEQAYDEVLENSVRAIGLGFVNQSNLNVVIEMLNKLKPTHLILRFPEPKILKWAIKNKIKTIAMLADSFIDKGIKSRIYHSLLAQQLNNTQIDWVFNHGKDACRSLQKIGVKSQKIIPWDWPHSITPALYTSKTLSQTKNQYQLFYAGLITDSKGIGDLIESLVYLKNLPKLFNLKIAGQGDLNKFQELATKLNVNHAIEFLGLVPNQNIIPLMRSSDLVIIPSRTDYPEGFPMIIYETLCSRTPLVASNHPMFCNKLKHQENAMIFPSGNSQALAHCINQILSDSSLYQQLSAQSLQTWQNLQIPLKWHEAIQYWIDDSPLNHQRLAQFCLSTLESEKN